tara:strand:+ start:280 stop:420 length:141 start_codon:yes stop_codon:yes gene_type:complete
MNLKTIIFLKIIALFILMYITGNAKVAVVAWSLLAGVIILAFFKAR